MITKDGVDPNSSKTAIGLSMFTTTVAVAISLIIFWQLPPQIPLFFSHASGQNQLANKWWFIIIPLLSIIFLITNLTLHKNLSKDKPSLTGLLSWMTFLVLSLLAAAAINITLLVF